MLVPRLAGTAGPRGTGRGQSWPEIDSETEYVSFDRPRVLRVLAWIIADLDALAGFPPLADAEEAQVEDAEARRVRHRRRLAEPDPPPKRLSMREERAMLRAFPKSSHPFDRRIMPRTPAAGPALTSEPPRLRPFIG